VFIALLLMNVMGYYGVFLGLSSRHDSLMVQRLDINNFSADQIVTISIPLSLPYAVEGGEYHRVDGKIEHLGVVYRLLKQKFANDTLSIQCIRDTDAERINHAMSAYVKTFSDAPVQSHPSGKVVINILKDFLSESCEILHAASAWQNVTKNSIQKVFIASYFADIVHPPERA
jgi:hypothetical protein